MPAVASRMAADEAGRGRCPAFGTGKCNRRQQRLASICLSVLRALVPRSYCAKTRSARRLSRRNVCYTASVTRLRPAERRQSLAGQVGESGVYVRRKG